MAKPKQVLNDPSSAVSEFLEGLLLQYPSRLRKLENHHVILSAKEAAGVRLISGGGSGHEPSHAGWVGPGMLSAAVCGGIFASPSVHSVLAAIRAAVAAGTAGGGSSSGDDYDDEAKKAAAATATKATTTRGEVLLIIKNYTGDRLNFGMAAERAAQEGIRVEMVVVADDCAVPRTKGITGSRGVAGTVLVHKIAGAAAQSGQGLGQVRDVARRACARMGTMGFALDSVTIPGADAKNERLNETTIEIGLGIHGEAGLRQSPLLSADELAKELVDTIQAFGRKVVKDDGSEDIVPMVARGDEVVVLVNNLGGLSNFEMSILARSCIRVLEGPDYGVKATRVMVGSYMTSFDMRGASLTVLNVQDQPDLVELLDAPTSAPAWNPYDVWTGAGADRPSAALVPEAGVDSTQAAATEIPLPELALPDFSARAATMLAAAVKKLAESESMLTEYDTIVGDGDCGITFGRGAREIEARLSNGVISTDHPVTMFSDLADAVSASMGGTSGVLLELMFRKISSSLRGSELPVGAAELAAAFRAGVDAVSLYGGATVGARTMLDALVPAAISLVGTQSLLEAAAKARQGADGTAKMKVATAGRSNWLSEESLEGTPDPGAIAVAVVFEAILDA